MSTLASPNPTVAIGVRSQGPPAQQSSPSSALDLARSPIPSQMPVPTSSAHQPSRDTNYFQPSSLDTLSLSVPLSDRRGQESKTFGNSYRREELIFTLRERDEGVRDPHDRSRTYGSSCQGTGDVQGPEQKEIKNTTGIVRNLRDIRICFRGFEARAEQYPSGEMHRARKKLQKTLPEETVTYRLPEETQSQPAPDITRELEQVRRAAMDAVSALSSVSELPATARG
ncbi:hypothetical protein EW146_g2284 [Bondarzewia mesenterica]|uniref:Uncharacterized protein n=1 Tax=Bondarzewia mesenterica TaxID=1095465 RepID=A0A4S4M2J6_9AGAM|nr:hypothetical protein EW146_g2284 [Bondarzewia mesenterica]